MIVPIAGGAAPLPADTQPAQPGDMRIVYRPSAVYTDRAYLVQWYGEKSGPGSRRTDWFAAENYGRSGCFATLEDAELAILGPVVLKYFRKP